MRIGIFIIVVVGLLGACYSYFELASAALPYQDPMPEMLERQSDQVRFWGLFLLMNILLLMIGFLGMWRFRRKN